MATVIELREESAADREAVFRINAAAFPSPAEAGLVDVLRVQASPIVSLVACLADELVGHIFFSPVTLHGEADLQLMGLAPMAVAPGRQNSGIGSLLVGAGLDRCRAIGAVVVLGHPDYYPRFGFVPASGFSIDSEYDVPDEVFMAQELVPGALRQVTGRIHYHPAFADL
jgi:putative acetyltransferase